MDNTSRPYLKWVRNKRRYNNAVIQCVQSRFDLISTWLKIQLPISGSESRHQEKKPIRIRPSKTTRIHSEYTQPWVENQAVWVTIAIRGICHSDIFEIVGFGVKSYSQSPWGRIMWLYVACIHLSDIYNIYIYYKNIYK